MWVLGKNWIRSDQEYRSINTSFSHTPSLDVFPKFLATKTSHNQQIYIPTCLQIPIVRTSQSSFVFVPRAEKQAVAKCVSPITISTSHHQSWCVDSRDRVWYRPICISLPGHGRSLASDSLLGPLLGLNYIQRQPTNLQHRNPYSRGSISTSASQRPIDSHIGNVRLVVNLDV